MTPLPGDLVLVKIEGWSGLLIRIMQAIAGDWSRFCHVMVVLDDQTVIGAQPGGALIEPLAPYLTGAPLAFTQYDLDGATRARIVAIARGLAGTPYSFLDYLSIALVTAHVRPAWLLRFVEDTGHMICSQLADAAYAAAGVQLFPDGRPCGDVTPGDIAQCGLVNFPPGPARAATAPATPTVRSVP